MLQLKILNSKEIKEVYSLIEKQWGSKLKLDYAFLQNNKNRVFIINKDISKIGLEKLRINSIGMYFCEIDRLGIRLSIEGSQIVGPKAAKNMVEIDEEQAKKWLKGEDLETEEENLSGFVILKHNDYFLGTGKHREGKILNYVGKERRISAF
ncbi:hypothetical protein HYU09_02810 [Candidatus Woesearchaeota archaeon]|nr:hypothetical protein [Candidatus Woesearchaeota archaeon]